MKRILLFLFVLTSTICFSSVRVIDKAPMMPAQFLIMDDSNGHMDGCDMDEAECPDLETCEDMHSSCMGDTDMDDCHSGMMESSNFFFLLLNFFKLFLFI